jgi:hypothetical protein
MKNNFRSRNHHFVAFAAHLLDQHRDLHFAARVDLERARRSVSLTCSETLPRVSRISRSRT